MQTAEQMDMVSEQPRENGVGRISLTPGTPNSKLKAFATVNYGGIVLKDMRIFEGDKGLFVRPASHKVGNRYVDSYYIADQTVRASIEAAVLATFTKSNQQPA